VVSCCRYRRDWSTLSSANKLHYIDTIKTIATDPQYAPLYNNLVSLYQRSFDTTAQYTMPEKSQFLPWHRYFMIEYENLLRLVDPSLTIPYWDWSLGATVPYNHPVFGPQAWFGDMADPVTLCVTTGPFKEGNFTVTPSAGSTCLMREYMRLQFPSRRLIEEQFLTLTAEQFSQFHNSLQLFISFNIRCYVGGHMCDSDTANDPLYPLLISTIDLFLDRWQAMDTARATAGFNSNEDLVLTLDDTKLKVVDFRANSDLVFGTCVQYEPLQPVGPEPRTTTPVSGPQLPTLVPPPLSNGTPGSNEKRSGRGST